MNFSDGIVIWGAGVRGRQAVNYIGSKMVLGFIDADTEKIGKKICGIKVFSFAEFQTKYDKSQIVLISPEHDIEKIKQYLQREGYRCCIEYDQMFGDKSLITDDLATMSRDELLRKIQTLEYKAVCQKKANDKMRRSFIKIAVNNYRVTKPKYQHPYEILAHSQNICFNFSQSEYISIFEKALRKHIVDKDAECIDLICFDNVLPRPDDADLIARASEENIPVLYMEDGFLESIVPWNNHQTEWKYRAFHSFVCDSSGLYLDARYPSDLENMLNSECGLTANECNRARRCIDFIVDNNISKYNHQPIKDMLANHKEKTRVLIIDQVRGDTSILYGGGSKKIMELMIDRALKENPGAQFLIKKHPVTMDSMIQSALDVSTVNHTDIEYIDYEINPISLLKSVDKVYVCSSLMGFEALMCGKEVHTFGRPFYSGWGLTVDYQQCLRRCRKRTLEELFYMAYIKYSAYIDYEKKRLCNIEECLRRLLALRKRWHKTRGEGEVGNG